MTRTRYGISPWIDGVATRKRLTFPRFRGDIDAPVVIIGAGLTGCATAYALAAAGVPALVLEANRLGQTGAGRASGVFRSEPCASFRALQARHGRRAARAMFELSRKAALDLPATVRRLALHADLETRDSLRLAVPLDSAKGLAREVSDRREAGLEARWFKSDAVQRLSAVEATNAARLRGWGLIDPYRLALGFARSATARGASIFEASVVRRLKMRRRHIEVHLPGGLVRAETVIVCTGEPGQLVRSLARHFKAEERYVVQTAAMPLAIRRQASSDAIVTDLEVPPHIVWRTRDHRFVVEGGDRTRTPPRTRASVLVQRTGQLMYELSRLFPPISGLAPEFGWDVPLATTADGVMYAGPHRNFPRHLFAWGSSHDPAQAFLASRILLRQVLGQVEREDVYFAFTRG
jgi:gamma-glutamylputrescine oxidase